MTFVKDFKDNRITERVACYYSNKIKIVKKAGDLCTAIKQGTTFLR